VELSYTSKTWGPFARQLYIRQALQHLITEPLYISRTLHGYGLPDYGPVADYPGSTLVAPSIRKDPYPYDPAAAARLLAAHGWVKGPGGYLVCKRPGTHPSECGKGIATGRKLTFLTVYSTGTTAFFAMVSAFQTAARKVGIDLKLNGRTVTTMFSTVGVCATAQQKESKTTATGACNWGLGVYSFYMWSYGQYQLIPLGEDQFGQGNFWAGGYYSPKAQRLITAGETKPGLKPLYAAETFLSKDEASLWWPLQDWYVAAVKKSLSGWQQLSPYATYMPQTWYYTSSR
jgi:peptide/nickel transport system substrate-binding protein